MQYRLQKLDSGLNPEICLLKKGMRFRNAERTGDDKAAIGSSWKEYWQIFTLEEFPNICPFCGDSLKEDDIDGCHINIKKVQCSIVDYIKGHEFTTKKYIIPGHHKCNMKLGEEFDAKIDITAVEAIEK